MVMYRSNPALLPLDIMESLQMFQMILKSRITFNSVLLEIKSVFDYFLKSLQSCHPMNWQNCLIVAGRSSAATQSLTKKDDL